MSNISKQSSRIFVTGDVHFPLDRARLEKLALMGLSNVDYLIVCGDMGVVWNAYGSELQHIREGAIASLPYTVLWVDGNHENFDALQQYEVVNKFNGKVRRITHNCYHLSRGSIYQIQGKSFFTFGGAVSMDKNRRIEGVSWWRQELPTMKQMEHGAEVLDAHKGKVDYIITHDSPSIILKQLYRDAIINGHNKFFDLIMKEVKFKTWFSGHHHINAAWDKDCNLISLQSAVNEAGSFVCLFGDVYCLETGTWWSF